MRKLLTAAALIGVGVLVGAYGAWGQRSAGLNTQKTVSLYKIEKLEIIHYAVSLGHHRSLVYWIPTAALMRSTFRHEGELLKRYRDFAGDGVFRFSVGLEDAEDICADLERVL